MQRANVTGSLRFNAMMSTCNAQRNRLNEVVQSNLLVYSWSLLLLHNTVGSAYCGRTKCKWDEAALNILVTKKDVCKVSYFQLYFIPFMLQLDIIV